MINVLALGASGLMNMSGLMNLQLLMQVAIVAKLQNPGILSRLIILWISIRVLNVPKLWKEQEVLPSFQVPARVTWEKPHIVAHPFLDT